MSAFNTIYDYVFEHYFLNKVTELTFRSIAMILLFLAGLFILTNIKFNRHPYKLFAYSFLLLSCFENMSIAGEVLKYTNTIYKLFTYLKFS